MQNNQRGRRSEKGATSVEYALIIILVVLGLGGAVKAIGTGIDGVYSGVADNVVAGAATGPASTPPASSTPPVPVKLTATASLAKGEMHPLAAPFSIDRFHNGALIDEHGAAAVAH